jgi:hypothetical protein
MPEQTFRDQAVNQLMYTHQQGGDVGLMLDQTPTNSRVNPKMAQFCLILHHTSYLWRGNYKTLFGDIEDQIQRHYLNMEGYSRVQAIDMSAAHSVTQEALQAKQKRGGILGMIGL